LLKKTILVTGAGGFIGGHLCSDLISRGYRVVGIDLKHPQNQSGGKQNGLRAIAGDFRNQGLMKELLDGVDIIFHLAGAHLQINLSDSEYWNVNVHSLAPLLQTAHQNGVKRFVHVSSVSVYGNLKNWLADETTPCKPFSIYGETKLAGEAEVKKFGREKGFPFVILRPAWVYGPGCPRTLKIFRAIRKHRFAMIGGGHNLRHPLYILDMLSSFHLAMESESAEGETFIIGGNGAITTRELIEIFCKVLNLRRPKIRLPMTLGNVIAAACESFFGLIKREPPISKRSLEFFQANNSFNITKAQKLLDFQPKFSFEEGLKDCRAWLESQ
jgi:nucleoside-diphosphate-sugar epimerase